MSAWFLALHIVALLLWAGALLYVPVLVAATEAEPRVLVAPARRQASLARMVFTLVATPAALATIIAGTIVFLVDGNAEPWLLVKLTLVTLLVCCHAGAGLLVLRAETPGAGRLRGPGLLLAAAGCMLMIALVWLVLAKPSRESLPWLG